MIKVETGDIFAIQGDVEAMVNTVNCVGVIGRGLARQFKERFPDNFSAYADACERKEVRPGRMFVFQTGTMMNPRLIINFPTKDHWRGKSRIEFIDEGLVALAEEIEQRNIRSIAIPPLGTDLGGLDWELVRELTEAALADLEDVEIVLLDPNSKPSQTSPNAVSTPPKMTRVGRL